MKIGIFGGGQLGRMMALAGYPFNLRFSFYEAAQDCPSAPLGQLYGDKDASQASLDAFIASADVFTYEFEIFLWHGSNISPPKNLFILV